MRTIFVYATTGYINSGKEESFEVEDNATDDEISDIAQEYIDEMIESGWYEKEEG